MHQSVNRSPAMARGKSTSLLGDRSVALDKMRGRMILIGLCFILVYSAVALRAFDVTVLQGMMKGAVSEQEAFFDYSDKKAGRGNIYDRNGVLLATTLPGASLFVDPSLVVDAKALAQDLTRIIPDLEYGSTLQKLQSQGRFVWLQRNISPAQQHAILQLGQPALGFEHEEHRFYPQGGLAAHMIGYASVDNNGLAGIERSFNQYLSGGNDLRLSMDIRLQHILHREVARAIKEFTGVAGVGVIMDVHTGEVLAGVSLPDFDPHEAGTADPNAMFNRMTLGVYELGSIFKIFTTAAALEKLSLPLGYQLDAREPIKIGRFKISDFHGQNRVMSLTEVFMHSSNIGTAKMAEMLGNDRLIGFYNDLGLLEPMDIVFKEVGKPQKPAQWRPVNTLTASYGHGISTTPLQTVAAVASIANGGLLVKPQFVVAEESGAAAKPFVRVLSEETSVKMRALMRLVVTEGTGSKAELAGYEIGGKTGTADKVGASGRYERGKRISSFVGVYPSTAPRYALLVMVDEPKPNKSSYGYATAGWVSAPAISRIVSSMATVLGEEPVYKADEQDLSRPLLQYVSLKEKR